MQNSILSIYFHTCTLSHSEHIQPFFVLQASNGSTCIQVTSAFTNEFLCLKNSSPPLELHASSCTAQEINYLIHVKKTPVKRLKKIF